MSGLADSVSPSLVKSYEIGSPYPGLRPFDRKEVRIFFGRRRHKDEMLSLLRKVRFLGVVGTSGCGKSSLVKAGLIPELNAGWMLESEDSWADISKNPDWVSSRWFIAEMRPGAHPFRALAGALLDSGVFAETWDGKAPESVPALAARLQMGPGQLIRQWELAAETPKGNLLVLVDQFEELFRFRDGDDLSLAQSFVRSLIQLAKQQDWPIYIVITMRSEFLGDCSQFPDLPELLNQGQYLVPRLKTSEIRDAIECPARMFGADFDELLMTRLLNDIGSDSDQLPLLQHALKRMWELSAEKRRKYEQTSHDGRYLLRLEDYERPEIGGVAKALDLHAEQLFQSLSGRSPDDFRHHAGADSDDRRIARILFQALTVRDRGRETRRPTRVSVIAEIGAVDASDIIRVADVFRHPDVGVLAPLLEFPITAETKLDLMHESVIRKWGRLRAWIESEARWAHQYKRLRDEVDNSALSISDTHLSNAEEWKKVCNPNQAWAMRYEGLDGSHVNFQKALSLIDRSTEERKRLLDERITGLAAESRGRLLLKMLMIVGVVALVAIGMGVFASYQRSKAEAERINAENAGKNAEAERDKAEEHREIARTAEIEAGVAQGIAESEKKKALDALETARQLQDELKRLTQKEIEKRMVARDESSHALLQVANEARKAGDWIRATHNFLHAARSISEGLKSNGIQRNVVLAAQLASGNIIQTIPGFGSRALVNRDSSLILAWDEGQVLRIWDLKANKRIARFDHGCPIAGAVLTDDESKIMLWSSSGSGRITVWDLTFTNGQAKDLPASPLITVDLPASVNGASFNRRGSQALTWGTNGIVNIWSVFPKESPNPPNPRTETSLATLQHKSAIDGAQFSNHGSRVLVVSDRTLYLWDTKTNKMIRNLQGHTSRITGVTFSPDDRFILSWSRDNTAQVWDSATGIVISKLVHDGAINGATFFGKSSVLTWSQDGKVRALDLEIPGEPQPRVFDHGQPVIGAQLSQDQTRLLIWGGNAACFWQLKDHRLINTWRHDGSVLSAQLNPKETQILTWSIDNVVRIWDANNAQPEVPPQQVLGHDSLIQGARLTDDGSEVLVWCADLSLKRWHAKDPRLLFSFPDFSGKAPVIGGKLNEDQNMLLLWRFNSTEPGSELAAFERAGDRFVLKSALKKNVQGALLNRKGTRCLAWAYNALGAGNFEMVDWDLRNPATIRRFDLPNSRLAVLGGNWSDDETRLLTWGDDNQATLWEVGDSSIVPKRSFQHAPDSKVAPPGSLNGAMLSRNGRRVLTWSADRTARVWDADAGKQLMCYNHLANVKGAAISSDGREILTWTDQMSESAARSAIPAGIGQNTGACAVNVWRIEGDNEFIRVRHDREVNGASLNQKNERLLTWSDDGTAVLWDRSNGKNLQIFRRRDAVLGAKFLRDESLVLTWGRDKAAALWDATRKLPLAEFKHGDAVNGALTNRDDTRLLTWSADQTAKWWDISLQNERLTSDDRILEFEVRTATEMNSTGEIIPLGYEMWEEKKQKWEGIRKAAVK